MIIRKVFTVLALAFCAIAAPMTPTADGNVTVADVSDFVGGICSFHNRIVQECNQPYNRKNDPTSWKVLTTSTIFELIDGAKNKYKVNPPFLKQIMDWGVRYKLNGLPETFWVDGYDFEREKFRYKMKQWDEYSPHDGAWCERGDWSQGALHCLRDQRVTFRTVDMDCFFPC
ncbi:hypothetical protein K505DRAFT_419095 [Melanomma pulvis-pyrius CBS 109.77]|uniref:Glycoside hydrolase family 18 protein n=1 Tax=Melanomma pulvis-pyrius CBS 109.77 TaxID=1314802 RepID=A0A6A6X5L8_9PLEO|nr:hypothetical protein K505DRAFT_419095 [Melanomma pulvis-pyrius CBS 109.77]